MRNKATERHCEGKARSNRSVAEFGAANPKAARHCEAERRSNQKRTVIASVSEAIQKARNC
ncbi:MAG: hypothetical protein LBH30_06940 [Prevotellaceae bacterium]|nr:hypothetical protein [Prevotellaceae bacterium]